MIGQFINEGVAMVGEGIEPASVEQAAAQAYYPAKVLALMDELTLTLPRKIRDESRRAVEESGGTWAGHPADAVVDRMVDEFGRTGRAGGAGFYEYDADGRRVRLWPGLREHFGKTDARDLFPDMRERMLFSEALDSVRCLEENVLTSVADANIGSIMGIGFPAWTGGVLQYINGYEGGLPGFVARARELAERYGERFEPPALLVEKAEKGRRSATRETLTGRGPARRAGRTCRTNPPGESVRRIDQTRAGRAGCPDGVRRYCRLLTPPPPGTRPAVPPSATAGTP